MPDTNRPSTTAAGVVPAAQAAPAAHDDDAPLRVEQQICYALHTTTRAFDAAYRTLLAEHGLSYPQYIALMGVGEHEPVTVGDLGQRLRLDSGTLSPLLKRMQTANLVERDRDPHDERRVRVRLTPTGREVLTSLHDLPRAMAERSGLTPHQLHELHDLLRTVSGRLDALTEAQPRR